MRPIQFLSQAYRTHTTIIQIKGANTYLTCGRKRSLAKPLQDEETPALSPFSLLFLALPLIEIAVFVIVGKEIGVLPTVSLVVLSGIAGGILLRIQGLGILARIRHQIEAGQNPGRELAHGVMIVVAGMLLLIPGFVTDVLGILLFIPPIRDFGWRLVKSRITVHRGFGADAWTPPPDSGKTIDLDDGDYSRSSGSRSPWQGLGKD